MGISDPIKSTGLKGVSANPTILHFYGYQSAFLVFSWPLIGLKGRIFNSELLIGSWSAPLHSDWSNLHSGIEFCTENISSTLDFKKFQL